MTWKKLAWLLITLALLRGAFSLCSQFSPRLYSESAVKEYFSAEYIEKAEVYKERRLQAQRFTVPGQILIDLLFIFGGPLLWLYRRLARTRWSAVTQGAAIIAAMVLFENLLRLPIYFFFGHRLEKEFGFSNQTAAGFVADYTKGLLLGLVIAVALTALFVWLYGKFRRSWVWLTGISFTIFTIFATFIIPLLIEPMFFDYKDLPAGALRTRIERLALSQNMRLENILVMKASAKTNRTNAYVSGLWGTHRVVLFDNLMKKFSEDEILAIVGHEMGHSHFNHIWKNLFFSVAMIWLAIPAAGMLIRWLTKIFPDPVQEGHVGVLLPLVLMVFSLANFAIEPAVASVSRRAEADADLFGLNVTLDPDAAIRMETKLTQDNLSDPNPRVLPYLWRASHPDPISRIRMAEEFRRARGAEHR